MSHACSLSSTLRSICNYGCIYRESAMRHLACTNLLVQKQALCIAPCHHHCGCNPVPKTKNEIDEECKTPTKNAKPPMQLL